MFNNLSVSISSSVNFCSSILKLPAFINLRASEFDFVMPNSVNIFGKCKVFSSGALYDSISSGAFLFIVTFSNEFRAVSADLSSYNSVTINFPSIFFI